MPENIVLTEQGAITEAEQAAREAAGTASAPVSAKEIADRAEERVLEDVYGDLGDEALTAVEGVASGLSLGLIDPLLSDEAELRARVNPYLRGGGELIGAVAPALVSGGAGTAGALARLTPAGRAARLGEALAARGGQVLGGAAEGAITGAAQGVSELLTSDDPVTLERAASVLSSNLLLGSSLGAGGGVIAKAAERGIQRAGRVLDETAESWQARAGVADDLAGMDKGGLRTARAAELDSLAQGQRAEREAAAQELAEYRAGVRTANPWLATDDAQTRKLLVQQDRAFRRMLDEPISLAENPRRALDPLRREAQALRRAMDNAGEMNTKLARQEAKMADELSLELATLPSNQPAVQLTGKMATRYGDWSGTKVTKAGIEISAEEAARFQGALAAGEVQGARAQSLEQLQGLLARNENLQQRILRSFEAPASPRLDAIGQAEDALAKGGERGMLESAAMSYGMSAVTGLLPGGPLGAAAALVAPKAISKLADLVGGRLGKAIAESRTRTAQAIESLTSTGKSVARRAPVVASMVLTQTSFGEDRDEAPKDLAEAYRRRERQLRAITAPGPDGSPQLSPSARAKVTQRLQGVAAASPRLADAIETLQARRVAFLTSKLPRRPDTLAYQLGPSRWQPSEMEIRQFARYVAAVEDPGGIEERLADGTMTPEDAEVMRMVYPERYSELRRQLVEALPKLDRPLPYERRLALSIFFGTPLDAALDPRVLTRLQANFAAEPATESGTAQPRPMPQFGSVARPEPTPAQERAGG